MARCTGCSAPLPANTNRCFYCGTRNDVDLHAWSSNTIQQVESERICPECLTPLQTIDLKIDGNFLIEHCNSCFGLFFDPGEIEQLLDHSVSNVFNVNFKHILNINKDRYQRRQIKYVPCPVCKTLMNRVNFGHRSGVVIDRCSQHGIWLNSGELTHLLEWKKAGGQILDSRNNARRNTKKRQRTAPPHSGGDTANSLFNSYGRSDNSVNLIENIASVIFRLFD